MENYDSEATYTLDDLNQWNFSGTSLAVLGYPIRHSISPIMHNTVLAELSEADPRFKTWRYFRFEVPPEKLLTSLPLFRKKGFHGINLTVPHKTIAIDGVKSIDPAAQPIGAINTLMLSGDGYIGFNTDGYGLEAGIKQELGRTISGSSVVLLGAGGAARAAAVQCLQSNCSRLHIINRNQDRLSALIKSIKCLPQAEHVKISGSAPTDPEFQIPSHALMINATSLGMKPDDPLPLNAGALSSAIDLYDMVYNPPMTKLMETVTNQGGNAANGLTMLAFQGAKSLSHWTGVEPRTETMLDAARSTIS
tara:strand:- start:2394 stop:3314 length:921 start_codon:yes stop_codon:yes gene_type:complete